MNPIALARHFGKDAGEILGKLLRGRPRAAWCALVTHGRNARLLLDQRMGRIRVECPCCGWQGAGFRTIDAECMAFHDVECPQCLAQERHRFLALYFARHPWPLLSPCRLLHVAPEPYLVKHFLAADGVRLLAMDLFPEKLRPVASPKFRGDLQALALADASVDGFACLHVLEHVLDDRRALAELYRVLRPGGRALIMVPLGMGLPATVEFDPAGPLLYGHVRDYSPVDTPARLAPFSVAVINPRDFLSLAEQGRHGVPDHEVLYLCTKP